MSGDNEVHMSNDSGDLHSSVHSPPSPSSDSISAAPTSNGDFNSDCESLSSVDSGDRNAKESEERGWWKRLKLALGLDPKPPLGHETWGNKVPQIIKPLSEYHNGYSKLAAYQDSDPNFLIFRKNGWLRNRLLEHYQDQLAELEKDLQRIDYVDSEQNSRLLNSRRLGKNPDSARELLFNQLKDTLEQYDELLLRTQQIMSIKRPTKRNQRSVYNFIENTTAQIKLEAEWIRHGHDLAAISTEQEYSWLNGFLEDTFRRISKTLTLLIFQTKSQHERTDSEAVLLVSQSRFNIVISIGVTFVATVMLLIPVGILAECVKTSINQIFLIFGFTLAFALCCATITEAKRQEIFAATAAYCAVLVIFVGNTGYDATGVKYVFQNGTVLNGYLNS